MWGAVFPAFIAGVAYVYDVSRVKIHSKRRQEREKRNEWLMRQNKYDWAGKRKGSSMLSGTPAVAAPTTSEE